MAMLVVLLPDGELDGHVGSRAAAELAALGVTRLAVLRNADTVGFVLEGWSFEPDRSAQPALDAIAGDAPHAATLRLVMDTAVHPASEGSGR